MSERDGGQCTFETADGRRCPAREGLEFHHDERYGIGGDRSAKNIRLLCVAHNAHMAELDYGKEKMDRYRRSADRAREPSPTLQLRPDGVHPCWSQLPVVLREPVLVDDEDVTVAAFRESGHEVDSPRTIHPHWRWTRASSTARHVDEGTVLSDLEL